jgi:hypothetical protein
VFLIHTIAICGGGYLGVRSTSKRVQAALAAIALAALLPGVEKTRRLWADMTASAQREATFYLSNPDKVLLSDQEAYWFIPGVTAMYDVQAPHYLLVKDLPSGRTNSSVPLWRFRDGQFVPDWVRDRFLRRHQHPWQREQQVRLLQANRERAKVPAPRSGDGRPRELLVGPDARDYQQQDHGDNAEDHGVAAENGEPRLQGHLLGFQMRLSGVQEELILFLGRENSAVDEQRDQYGGRKSPRYS